MPEDLVWVQIRSWHVFRTWSRVPRLLVTECNRRRFKDESDLRDTFPEGEKTCESCLRVVARRTT